MKKVKFGILSSVFLAIDLLTKHWIQTNLSIGEAISVIPGFFDLTYYQNTGGAWSMLDGPGMRPVFLLISLAVTVFAVWIFLKEENTILLIALCLIIPGNLGNFIDRLSLGYVRDMLAFNIFGYNFPVFNVADMCLVVGFGFVFLHMYLEEKRMKNHA